MTHATYVTLENASYHLPDGSPLFTDLNLRLDQRLTGLVGRNGVGKSVLARLIAGDIFPSSGRCLRNGRVFYLAQHVSPDPTHTVADLLGVKPVIEALERIELGSFEQTDFDLVGDQWNIRQQLLDALALQHLCHLTLATPACALSGGEAMRVALMGAFLSNADLLILDEPTNHLDSEHRHALHQQLKQWASGLLVISHDRNLLEQMQNIVELSSLGISRYSGGYSSYAHEKMQQQRAAQQQLTQAKVERQREERTLSAQRERLERKQARGNKQASHANQAKILIDRQKQRSQNSSGKLRVQQDTARAVLTEQVRAAARHVEEQQPIVVYPPQNNPSTPLLIAQLTDLRLPFGHNRPINLTLTKGQRIALTGPNGCGKSTLLKVLAGELPVVSGGCQTFVSMAFLDQRLALLKSERSIFDQLRAVNRELNEGELRTRLAQLGLGAGLIHLPCEQLSGGEQLKAAMACVFYASQPSQLLMLDEPANHLDLPSIQALESMLNHYTGTLIVTSHDERFLAAIGITHRLHFSPCGSLNWLE